MLRTPCRKGPLTWVLQSIRLPKAIRPIGPVHARQPLCTSQRCLKKQLGSAISSRKSQEAQEEDGQEKEGREETWDPTLYSTGAADDHVDEVNAPLAKDSTEDVKEYAPEPKNEGWTSLRSRLEANVEPIIASDRETFEEENVQEQTPQAENAKEEAAEGKPKKISAPPGPTRSKKAGKGKSRRKTKAEKVKLNVEEIHPSKLEMTAVDDHMSEKAPALSYNLDRVLFNPGVYHMQDHRSGVFNFDPYLASIMPVKEFDYSALKDYVTSSKDDKLRELCKKHGLKYCGSTSSMTSILSHFHFLLSGWRMPYFGSLSKSLTLDSNNFTVLSRAPVAAFAHFKDGVYAVDSDKEYETGNILSTLGKSMEKLLTLPKEEYELYRRSRSHELPESERCADETYHYTTLGGFMMRSQLDAYDPRLPGTGVFDLKTRAVITIRMDVVGYEKGVGYEIRRRFGPWESFEREYSDMIRSAFLKYSLQVRMGRMDGIFVAYHNTQRIFGFQYISLAEMDQTLHGTRDPRVGDQEFKCSVALLNNLLDRASKRFPGRTLRLHVETRPTKIPLTYFFVEPVTEQEMQNIQDARKPLIEQLKREIEGLSDEEHEAESVEEVEAAQVEEMSAEELDKGPDDMSFYEDLQNEDTWKELMSKVDEAVENESLGVGSIRDAVQEALQHSGLLQGKTEEESDKYVDDLVAALTAHSIEAKELGESQVSQDDAVVVDTVVADAAVDSVAAIADAKAAAAADESDSTVNATLANLILKVTQSVNEKNPNLRAFERKVADLASQSSKESLDSTRDDEAKAKANDSDESAEEFEASDSVAATTNDKSQKKSKAEEKPVGELLGMYVTIRNQVNGEFVTRPSGLQKEEPFDWTVQYTVTEIEDQKARTIYKQIKKRRKDVFLMDPKIRAADWYRIFGRQLPIVTQKGREFREEMTKREAGKKVYVAWDTEPLPPGEAGQTE
ncbi:hypothetical protein E4U55_000509 [Claviceps digitariae]|nr:hypothetical protein E4U55_000509 [Claviceps digitariae]